MNLRARQRGFTLIEIAAVVVILGLLASAATLSVVRLAQRATLDDAARGLANFDATARLLSTHDDEQVRLIINEDEQALVRVSKTGTRRFVMPRGVKLRAVATSPQELELRHAIGVTYAVTLASNDETVTLLFAGVGGQVSRHEQEGDVDAIFANLQ